MSFQPPIWSIECRIDHFDAKMDDNPIKHRISQESEVIQEYVTIIIPHLNLSEIGL